MSCNAIVVVLCSTSNTQVLPPDVMLLAEPSPEDLLAAVDEAIQRVPHLDPLQQHERVSDLAIVLRCAQISPVGWRLASRCVL